ncbi:MAG: YbaK/EbsC family protein [wastewater metagenome]|nr:YbaK/EbsC family protein [Candidatus Loosdrechtia aerotolerans]
MPVKRLKAFLDTHGVRYITIYHSRAFTAQETAVSAHIPKRDLAKTVMVKIDGRMAMAVLPASCKIDLDLLKKVVDSDSVELANEREFKSLFPACEVGAMPPFGNLYGMEVFVSEDLAKNKEIAFNAGSHRELVMMGYKDFERLVQPKVSKFCIEIQ